VRETLIALAALVVLCAIGWLVPILPLEWVLSAGIGCVALGMLLGVPTGFWYHVRLYRALRAHGPLPARWWLRPTALHADLSGPERAAVLRWFYLGGAGFLLTAAGCACVMLAVGLAFLRIR